MKKNQIIKVVAIVLVGVALDILLHVVSSPFSTIPENPAFSFVTGILGTEITASLWALFAFSSVAFVFLRIRNEIPGEGIKKGLRYGSAIALLWLIAMLEGVSLFGNPLIKEFVVGLSDAIPVFVMSVLLSLLQTDKVEDQPATAFTLSQKIKTLLAFSGIFLVGRYIVYFSGLIQSGVQTRPLLTLTWTILMGFIIGVVFVLLGNNRIEYSFTHRAVKFGFQIFGLNWAAFLLFMPLLFSGYIADALLRIIIDITLAIIASYLTIILVGKMRKKKISSKQTINQESVIK